MYSPPQTSRTRARPQPHRGRKRSKSFFHNDIDECDDVVKKLAFMDIDVRQETEEGLYYLEQLELLHPERFHTPPSRRTILKRVGLFLVPETPGR